MLVTVKAKVLLEAGKAGCIINLEIFDRLGSIFSEKLESWAFS